MRGRRSGFEMFACLRRWGLYSRTFSSLGGGKGDDYLRLRWVLPLPSPVTARTSGVIPHIPHLRSRAFLARHWEHHTHAAAGLRSEANAALGARWRKGGPGHKSSPDPRRRSFLCWRTAPTLARAGPWEEDRYKQTSAGTWSVPLGLVRVWGRGTTEVPASNTARRGGGGPSRGGPLEGARRSRKSWVRPPPLLCAEEKVLDGPLAACCLLLVCRGRGCGCVWFGPLAPALSWALHSGTKWMAVGGRSHGRPCSTHH